MHDAERQAAISHLARARRVLDDAGRELAGLPADSAGFAAAVAILRRSASDMSRLSGVPTYSLGLRNCPEIVP